MDIMEILRREAIQTGCMFLYHNGGDMWRAYGTSAYFAANYFPFATSYTEQITGDVTMWITEVSIPVHNLQKFIGADRKCAVIRLGKLKSTVDDERMLEWGKRLTVRHTVSMMPE